MKLGGVFDGGCCGDEVDAGVGGEEVGELVDEGGLDEGLVALNIDEMSGVGELGSGLGDTVGAGGVLGGGHGDGGSEGFGGFFDSLVISGDDDGVEFLALAGALEDVLEEGLSAEVEKRLPGEASGGPSGGDDSDDLRCFGGSVQVMSTGFGTLGKFLTVRQGFAAMVTNFPHE